MQALPEEVARNGLSRGKVTGERRSHFLDDHEKAKPDFAVERRFPCDIPENQWPVLAQETGHRGIAQPSYTTDRRRQHDAAVDDTVRRRP